MSLRKILQGQEGFGLARVLHRQHVILVGYSIALAGLATHFVADLIRTQQEHYPWGTTRTLGRLTSIIFVSYME